MPLNELDDSHRIDNDGLEGIDLERVKDQEVEPMGPTWQGQNLRVRLSSGNNIKLNCEYLHNTLGKAGESMNLTNFVAHGRHR